MVKVNFIGENKAILVEKGTTILAAAQELGIVIESPCNSEGVCGKCKVRISEASLKNVEEYGKHQLSEEEKEQGFVLSCQTSVTGHVDVKAVAKNRNKTLQILNHGQSFEIDVNSFIKKEYTGNGKTIVTAGGKVLGEEEGDTTTQNYGVVVDIGTTTLVATLVNINTGEELHSVSALNPQSLHAQDVLSRIKFASDEKGLDFTKAVLLVKDSYISQDAFEIPRDEFNLLIAKEYVIKERFGKYVERYITAHTKKDANMMRQFRFSTLINYHPELGIV